MRVLEQRSEVSSDEEIDRVLSDEGLATEEISSCPLV